MNREFIVRTYQSSDFEDLVEIFLEAFLDGPLYQYVIADRGKRRHLMRKLMLKVLPLKLKYRTTYVLETSDKQVVGAIFWYRKNEKKAGYPFVELIKSGLVFFPLMLPWSKIKSFLEYDEFESTLIQNALKEGYHVLDYMAIAKAFQGKGAGSILVQTEYSKTEKQFVFTGYPENIRFYERNGYLLDETHPCFNGNLDFYSFKHIPIIS